MSLTLIANTNAISPNLTTYFLGTGGTSPYTYTVVPGGAGGSINATTGFYTSPGSTGIDTIQVQDSLAATATKDIIVGTPLQLFCDILRNQLDLEDDQVFLWDQKFNLPQDSRLYIAVSLVSCKPFSNNNGFDSDGNFISSTNFYSLLSLDIFSRNTLALDRKEEVILALKSIYSEQQQNLNSFFIAPLPTSFLNLSSVEGPAIPYRFNISVAIQYFVKKTPDVPYFDTFESVEVTTDP